MAQYKKHDMLGGKWVKASELGNVKKAKIVSETNPRESNFKNEDGTVKMQDVCKVQFEGLAEVVNVSLNKTTINGLVDAFGEDSKNWMGHSLSVETEKVRVAGKAVTSLYLIPEGFHKIDDESGYASIVKIGSEKNTEKVLDSDLPF